MLDDPSMGWARYAHSMRVFCFNSGLFYIRPTEAALQLLETVMHRIETEAGWDQAIFNEVRPPHPPPHFIGSRFPNPLNYYHSIFPLAGIACPNGK